MTQVQIDSAHAHWPRRYLVGIGLIIGTQLCRGPIQLRNNLFAADVSTRKEGGKGTPTEPNANGATAQSRPAEKPKSSREAAKSLVEAIENSPGFWDQMCAGPVVVSRKLCPYTFTRFSYKLTADQFWRLRATRDAVVQAIRDDIRSWLTRSKSPSTGEEIHAINSHRLVMLIDLNGVEALDALCDVAEKSPLGVPNPGGSPRTVRKKSGPRDDRPDWDYSRSIQESEMAEMLSTITAILRQEGYEPLLKSDLEEAYCKKLQEIEEGRAIEGQDTWEYVKLVGPESQPVEGGWAPHYLIDDHCKALTDFWPKCWFPMTEARRRQIVKWGRDYLRSTPPEKRKAAKGMHPWPIIR